MEISDLLLHQIIKNRMVEGTDKVADAAVILWEQIATHIISIVGEGGFNSLYTRSVFLTQSTFPWLSAAALSSQNGSRFAELKICLEAQTPAEASAANCLLLTTFTGILASLIGEQLTTNILRSGWNLDASDSAGEELKNA